MPKQEMPDIELYKHLTHKERMLAGFPYSPRDKELQDERIKAKQLTKKYNELEVADKEGKQKILDELLSPACRGKKLAMQAPFRVDYGYNLTFGNNLHTNFDCLFLDCAPITVGDNCFMGPGVHIYAATHPLDAKYRQDNDDYCQIGVPVKIGNNVWLGGRSVICPGVTIGDNVVVAAGAVVVKDVPPNTLVGGNPAKIIRQLD